MEQQAQTKKLRTTKPRCVYYMDDFQLHENAHCSGNLKSGKTGGVRFTSLQSSPLDESKILLQFSGGGSVPPFGIKTDNEHDDGTTSLNYNIESGAEVQGLEKFNRDAIKMAIANKDAWWPKGITNEQINDNYAPIFKDKVLKKDGVGYWPPSMKVKLPLDTTTGELKACQIVDTNGCDLSYTELPSSRWDRIVIEITGFYFAGKFSWGVQKQLFKFEEAALKRGETDPSRVVFLPKREVFLVKSDIEKKVKTDYLSFIGNLKESELEITDNELQVIG
jgi:hypothetical protein